MNSSFLPELLLDPVPLLEVVPQNGDLANLKKNERKKERDKNVLPPSLGLLLPAALTTKRERALINITSTPEGGKRYY